MKFYESGDSSKPVIFLFPGTCCLYSSFYHVLDGLHSYFYTVTVSYDGFDPNEKRLSRKSGKNMVGVLKQRMGVLLVEVLYLF